MNLPDIIRLIPYGITAYTFVSVFHLNKGPWDWFDKIRKLTGVNIIETSQTIDSYGTEINSVEYEIRDNFLAKMFSCPVCLSGWFSLAILLPLYRLRFDLVAIFGAIWGIAYLLIKWDESL